MDEEKFNRAFNDILEVISRNRTQTIVTALKRLAPNYKDICGEKALTMVAEIILEAEDDVYKEIAAATKSAFLPKILNLVFGKVEGSA